MHLDLAAFEAPADGRQCCLVVAITIEIDKMSKLFPIFVPIANKIAIATLASRFSLENH